MSSWQDIASADAAKYGIDPATFIAQIQAESSGDPNAVSKAGCQGIAQICDAVTFNPFDPIASLDYAANRMAQALSRYGGNYALALGSYNCGGGCADRVAAGKQSWPAETQAYIAKILGGGSTSTTDSSGDTSSASSTKTTAFAPTALSSQTSTLIIVFAALVLLIGIWAMTRGGGAPATPAPA